QHVIETFLEQNRPQKQDKPLGGFRRLWLELFFLTMPIHKWMISRQARKYYFLLKQTQYLSPMEMRALQETRLRDLLNHAYHNVPYYRDRFDEAGLHPTDIESIEDLLKVPFLTK